MKKKFLQLISLSILFGILTFNVFSSINLRTFSNLTLVDLISEAKAHCNEDPCAGPPYDGWWKLVGDCYDEWGQWNGCGVECWSTGSCPECSDNLCDS